MFPETRSRSAVRITPLEHRHIVQLVRLHQDAPEQYSQHFSPFSFDEATLGHILRAKLRDLYFVVLVEDNIAGMYMLRGFDEGFHSPAYGVWISHRYSGKGLALQTLEHAVITCQALACDRIMLKVHPDNQRAKAIYERFGFRPTRIDPENQNIVYSLQLDDSLYMRNN